MKNNIEYKSYIGTVEFSKEDKVYFGKVIGIKSLVSYEGSTEEELIKDFQHVVDEYLVSLDEKREYKNITAC